MVGTKGSRRPAVSGLRPPCVIRTYITFYSFDGTLGSQASSLFPFDQLVSCSSTARNCQNTASISYVCSTCKKGNSFKAYLSHLLEKSSNGMDVTTQLGAGRELMLLHMVPTLLTAASLEMSITSSSSQKKLIV